MNSCHIFNFLFGTKRATTELARCFSATGEQTFKAKRRDEATQPPRFPLKQLQTKLVSFASQVGGSSFGEATKTTTTRSFPLPSTPLPTNSARSCDYSGNSGTYRATLVHSLDGHDDGERGPTTSLAAPTTDSSSHSGMSVCIVDNPIAKLGIDDDEQTASRGAETNDNFDSDIVDKNNNSASNRSHAKFHPILEIETKTSETSKATETKPHQLNKRQIILYENELCCKEDEHKIIKSPSPSTGGESKQISEQAHQTSQLDVNNNDLTSQFEPQVKDVAQECEIPQADIQSDTSRDKRSAYVRSIVRSFESSSRSSIETADSTITITPRRQLRKLNRSSTTAAEHLGYNDSSPNFSPVQSRYKSIDTSQVEPITYVKPKPPKTPPKTIKAKYFIWQLSLANKPTKIEELTQDEQFLQRFFNYLEPLDRCTAAQVCRKWRSVLYGNKKYWKELVSVIDCTQLRRDQLVECILATLQSASLKHQSRLQESSKDLKQTATSEPKPPNKGVSLSKVTNGNSCNQHESYTSAAQSYQEATIEALNRRDLADLTQMFEYLDQDDIWRIQDFCNRYTHRNSSHLATRTSQNQIPNNCPPPNANMGDQNGSSAVHPNDIQQSISCLATKSSSIPSNISSTLSSVSLSSLLSPLSESSRVESIKEKLYASLDERGFEAICLFGATDEDIDDLINKMPSNAHYRIQVARFNNCCITDRGLETFISTFSRIEELELSGCNEITNAIEFEPLNKLRSLIVTDCINIADGFADRLVPILDQLEELTIQAYHLTDSFIDHLNTHADISKLKRLELPDCKEVTNHSLYILARNQTRIEALSISGSSKITDDGIEVFAEKATRLRSLDLSWCTKISDASLECIACDLGNTLTDLILDRNVHITDNGVGYLATMNKLTLLHLRWCPMISDMGLEFVLSIKSLRYLSIAGLQLITARSLLCLTETDLIEVELTNCQAVNNELLMFLTSKMPRCNIIF